MPHVAPAGPSRLAPGGGHRRDKARWAPIDTAPVRAAVAHYAVSVEETWLERLAQLNRSTAA